MGVDGEADWGREWAGLGKAAPSFSIQHTEVEDSEVQRPKGPMAQSSSQASLRSLQRAEVEIGGVRLGPRMKANHKGYLKSIHAWKKESSTNTYLKK